MGRSKIALDSATLPSPEPVVPPIISASGRAHTPNPEVPASKFDPSPLSAADRTSLDALQKETDTLNDTIEGFRRVTRPLDLTHERFPVRWLIEDALRLVRDLFRVRQWAAEGRYDLTADDLLPVGANHG